MYHRVLARGSSPAARFGPRRAALHVVDAQATPPFPVRCGLVGVVTAAATPVFPVVGAYRLVAHVVPHRGVRVALVGGACGVFS